MGAAEIQVGGSSELDVSAAANFTISAQQILGGFGSVTGDVVVAGSLIPRGLSFSNDLTLAAGSTTTMVINRNTLSAPEQVICAGTLTYGGNLVVTQFGDPLQIGDTFDLFGFTGNPGNFANLTLPPLDPGLAWNTSNLAVDGTISVVVSGGAGPQLSSPHLVNDTNFVLTITGGTNNGSFRMLSHTNVTTPVSDWESLSTNTFDASGNLTITNLVNPAEPKQFFRAVQP